MKLRPLLFAIALVLFGACFCSAQVDATMGTWKINEAKSRLPGHIILINSDTYKAEGDQIGVISDALAPDGKHLHIEWIGKFDGNDYPCSGDPTGDLRSYRPVDDHTILMTKKKDGKTIITVKIVLASDGKSRTVYMTGIDQSGKPVSAMAFQEKQ